MECNAVQEKLSLYIDGVLDEGTLEEIESHLNSCDDCRIEFKAMKAIVAITGEIEEVEPPAALNAAIKQNVKKARFPVCTEVLQVLSEYVDGRLPDTKAARVRMHISVCPKCEEEMEMLERTVGAVASVGQIEPPSDLRSRIAYATTLKESGVLSGVLARIVEGLRPRRLGWAAAGVTAAAAIAGIMMSQPQRSEAPRMAVKPAPSPAREISERTPIIETEKPQKVAVVAPESALKASVNQKRPVMMALNPVQEPAVETGLHTPSRAKMNTPVPPKKGVTEPDAAQKTTHKTAGQHDTNLVKAAAEQPVVTVPANDEPSKESQEANKVIEVAELASNSEEVKQEPAPSLMKIAVAPPNPSRDLHEYTKAMKQEIEKKRPSGDPDSLRLFGKRF